MIFGSLEVASSAEFSEKVRNFQAGGAARVHVLMDFDRTLTVAQPGHDDATTWQTVYAHLPKRAQEDYDALFAYYRGLEVKELMTVQDSIMWSSCVLDICVDNQIDLAAVERDFTKVVNLRPGTKEVFDICQDNNIPTPILSAGVKNVINFMLQKADIKSDLTIATEIEVDEESKAKGWKSESLVHIYNKKEIGHAELERLRVDRPNCILIGDSMSDAAMVEESFNGVNAEDEGDTIRIRIVDPRSDETLGTEEINQATFARFDALDRSRNLYSIAKLIETIVSR